MNALLLAILLYSGVQRALIAQGGSQQTAPVVATAVVHYAQLRKLPIDLVIGVIGVENPELSATARNPDGSLGIMQVQPLWLGVFKDCGRELQDVATNICIGTAVLALNIREAKTLEGALLRYNGCRSEHCRTYAVHVLARMRQAARIRNE